MAEIAFSTLAQRARPTVIADLMHRALEVPGLLSLAAGFTDNSTLPLKAVSQAAAALQASRELSSLQYGSNNGREKLRAMAAAHVASMDGMPAYAPEALFISNGSQQALHLALQTLADPGDVILVEAPTYFVMLEAAAALGLECRSLPALPNGALDLAALPAFLKAQPAGRLKAIYLNTYYANPSGRCRTVAEKQSLAEALLTAGHVLPVLEDGAYRDLWFTQPWPAPSVLALPAFEPFPKLYLGTFTKPFASGLKVGYGLCTHPQWREKILALKGGQDFGTAHFNQCLLEKLLADGEVAAHLDKLRPFYAAKARVTGKALDASSLRDLGWQWETPEGGLYYWLRGPETVATGLGSRLKNAALEQRVLYVPGSLCFAEGQPDHCIRLSYGALPMEQLAEAVHRLAEAIKSCS